MFILVYVFKLLMWKPNNGMNWDFMEKKMNEPIALFFGFHFYSIEEKLIGPK